MFLLTKSRKTRHAREGLSCATEDVRENHSSRMESSDRVRTGPAGRTHPAISKRRRHIEALQAAAARAATPEGSLARAPTDARSHRRGLLYLRLGPRPTRAITLVSLVPCVRAGSRSMLSPLPLNALYMLARSTCSQHAQKKNLHQALTPILWSRRATDPHTIWSDDRVLCFHGWSFLSQFLWPARS